MRRARPLRVQILSFQHTKFSNRNCLGSPHPPYEVHAPPTGKSWIRHRTNQCATNRLIGLSKERPILGDHPKAHTHEIQWNSCGFHEIHQISCRFHMKSTRFHADFMKSGRYYVESTYKTYKTYKFRKTNCQEW